ncbi:MAG: nuclear transport factor 2 family protein [Gloeocapsa sp. UFS-A4-WI-NPMV-4B04]|jgi:hypothetical protein|nr:nuclear transport factor 2 family protein [Gloeocapsa sp. UFS-A4-WI-NPMV-4B04]
MRKFITFSRYLFRISSKSQLSSIALLLLTLALTTSWNRATAAPPQTAPPQLQNMLTQIDTAANQRNVKAVMQFYSPNFTHSDGLTRQNMENALTQLWQRYPQLKYQTQLQSWQNEGRAIIAETITNISGSQTQDSRKLALKATIKSRQRYENGKIVRQDILSENSQLSAGAKPPTVNVRLPQKVKVGQQYNFDAIVQEPLGDDYLLGAAIEEPIRADKYLNPTPVELELLPAGGLFKIGRAPNNADNRWISAILVRGDGMTMVTQRLQVVGAGSATTQKPAARSQ